MSVKRILYLEDDEALAFVTQRALIKKGYDVLCYNAIEDVIAAIKNTHFDYALLDLKIGNNTSLELIAEIRKVTDIPVVLISGYGTIRTAVQAMRLGAINFLSKPCTIAEIIAAFDQEKNVDFGLKESEVEIARPSLKNMEWEAIQKALDDNEGNISAAAKQLKLHRRTLQRKLIKKRLDNYTE